MALKLVGDTPGEAESVRQVVLRALSSDEAMIDAIEDDGRQVTIRFRLVVDPVLMTERMDEVADSLARAGHRRAVLPMLRLI